MTMEREMSGIENVFMFVSDACRWDAIGSRLDEWGRPIKTVAASTFTAPSFSSMISGVYPPRHGVTSWSNRITRKFTLFNAFEGWNKSLWTDDSWAIFEPRDQAPIFQVLGSPPRVSPEAIEPPFIMLEDDRGGHCPYGRPLTNVGEGDCHQFFDEYGRKGTDALEKEYLRSIDQSIEAFRRRLGTLADRGLLDTTLVIFTSDHGEMLGEHGGFAGHGRPATPELVYVPTLFLHPSVESKLEHVDLMRHVDLVPTLCHVLGQRVPSGLDGIDLLSTTEAPDHGLNFHTEEVPEPGRAGNTFKYRAHSTWEVDGGLVVHDANPVVSRLLYLYNILISKAPTSPFQRSLLRSMGFRQRMSNLRIAVRTLSSRHLHYGETRRSEADLEALVRDYLAKAGSMDADSVEYSEEAKDRLRALGYME